MESIVDLAFLVIRQKSLRIPGEENQAFIILKEAGIISENLSIRLKDGKGMRNILAHQYGNINDELVFQSITKELVRDAKEFIDTIEKIL